MCDEDFFSLEKLAEEFVKAVKESKRLKNLIFELAMLSMSIERGDYKDPKEINQKIKEAIVKSHDRIAS